MKKDDKLQGNNTEEEEDLFDLSLDDLEPEDTIIEAHVDEADDEVIELIDLVEKGDIDLPEGDREETAGLMDTIQEIVDDDLKTDKTLNLLGIPLDESLDLEQLDELKDEDTGIEAVEITEVEADLMSEMEPGPADTIQTAEVIFDDIDDESALKELIADEEALKIEPEIEGTLQEPGIEELSIEMISDEPLEAEPESLPEEPEQPEMPSFEEETPEEIPPVVEESMAQEVEESPQMPPPEAMLTAVSEEQIEAAIKKTVEDTIERVARETISGIIEKTAREIISEVIEKTARETITDIIEKTARETMTEAQDRIAREMNETVERVTRETTAGVAERIITDAINALKTSIESVQE